MAPLAALLVALFAIFGPPGGPAANALAGKSHTGAHIHSLAQSHSQAHRHDAMTMPAAGHFHDTGQGPAGDLQHDAQADCCGTACHVGTLPATAGMPTLPAFGAVADPATPDRAGLSPPPLRRPPRA